MDFNKDRLKRLVDRIACNVKKDEDYGLRCLHLNELNGKLDIFYKKFNPQNDSKIHQEIFQEAVTQLEKWDYHQASLYNEKLEKSEASYLVSGI